LKSITTDRLRRALKHLEAERRGRALGFEGARAVAAGEWLEWLWSPGIEVMKSPVLPTTTYSGEMAPKNNEQASDLSG
jgi:hypothetical protein